MIAMAVGTVLALLALGYVLYPLLAGSGHHEEKRAEAICPKCGARLHPDASFCSSCGSALDQWPGRTGLGNRS
ncbi:MAG: zinc ribbon domain-containing protein [Gemmatimonadaceae bacterium]|nr:zinc ribbon domain-containing protein [Gemmatimonadaceae bacterium]